MSSDQDNGKEKSSIVSDGVVEKLRSVNNQRKREGGKGKIIKPPPCLHTLVDETIISHFEKEKGLKAKEKILESLQSLTLNPQQNTDEDDTDKITLEKLQENNPNSSYKDCWEVKWMSREDVIKKIETIYGEFDLQKNWGERAHFIVQQPRETIYVNELECIMAKGKHEVVCYQYFKNYKENFRFTKLDTLLNLVHNLRTEYMQMNKRGVHYAYEHLFNTEAEVDSTLDSICAMIGCTRNNLKIFSSGAGKVIGDFSLQYNGETHDCSRKVFNILHPNVDETEFVIPKENKPLMILLVEKETVFQRLVEEKFHEEFKCIIITGSGEPDIATRIILNMLTSALKLEVVVLIDCNPYGFEILLTYLCGSKKMAYNSRNLRTRGIKWLGIWPTDLLEYHMEDYGFQEKKMTEEEISIAEKKLQRLLNKEVVKNNPKWKDLLQKMTTRIQIEGLSCIHLNFLNKIYLKEKLQNRDWV